MKNTEKSTKKTNVFISGADSDTNEKILGSISNQKYIDATNMAVRGKGDKALQFVGGEQRVYGSEDAQWETIGAWTVNNHVVEVLVNSATRIVQFKIDGVVMVETDQLYFDSNHPLQGDTNDRCDGGELYTTDNMNPVYIFNIQDIIDAYNAGLQTYFAQFNPNNYQAVLKTSPHHPVFIQLETLSGAGLLVGKYTYSIRYADDTGNKTSWSVQTPLIPVPMANGVASLNHPAIKKYGASPGNLTDFGIRLRFRVENVGGYQYIQIRRVAHNDGLQYGYIPTPEIIKLLVDANGIPVDIINGPEMQVIDWIDSAALNAEWEELTDEEDTISISGSFTAKTLRYFQNRLVPMNITYPSKDIEPYAEDMFVVKNDKLGFPVIEKLTDSIDREGFQKVDNQVRYPHLQSGERYGWGAYVMDDFGARSFVIPLDDLAGHDLKDYQMPNRRDQLSAESREYSVTKWKGAAYASDVNSNLGISKGYVHEVFDLVDARQKTDICQFHNILSEGGKYAPKVNNSPFDSCTPGVVTDDISTGFIPYVLGSDVGHTPFTPVADIDPNVSGHNSLVNMTVGRITEDGSGLPVPEGTWDYNPRGFAPNYYSTGMGIWGMNSLPSWARAFSVVRTKPAGRVVAQGIGFWKFKTDSVGATSKEANRFMFYSPDIDSALTGQISMDDIVNNPLGYQIQLVSPLGAFTEVYDGEREDIQFVIGGTVVDVSYNRGVDMAVYVRQMYEDQLCNPTYNQGSVGNGDGYVSFGRWLNSISSGHPQASVWSSNNGNHVFQVNAASIHNDGRSQMLDVTVGDDIYSNGGINNNQFTALDPEFWCEPMYIVNIIRNDIVVPVGNINEYVETGHLQKVESRIGISNGNNNQSFILVDERWEDCIPNRLNPNYSDEQRFVYVNGLRWWNVTYKSTAFRTAVLNALQLSGIYTLLDVDVYGNSVIYPIYGVYTHQGDPGSANFFYINFNKFDNNFSDSLFIPPVNADITVRYDNRIPLKIFAGDSVVAENNFVPIDRKSDANSGTVDNLALCSGIPYQRYDINDRVYLVKRTAGGGDKIQDKNDIYPKEVRQILVNFICESRVNIPYLYGSRYPHVHYVMRPHRWQQGSEADPAAFLTANNMVFAGAIPYYDNYGFEWVNWQYGGFMLGGGTNIDYQKVLNDRTNVSKPAVGFTEQTKFCTRVIWSNKRSINEQDDPNLKSFPSLNVYDISDAYGEIKYAYDNDSEKGNNLFALTDHGVCLLITDKRILSDFTGTEIANIKTDTGFMQGEYWLRKDVGSSDEMWRGIAEYGNQIFFPNNSGVYTMKGLSVRDILRGDVSKAAEMIGGQYQKREVPGYLKKLGPYLDGVLPGYATPMCAAYDVENGEYVLCLGSVMLPGAITPEGISRNIPSVPKSFIYSNDASKEFWSGEADYFYEKMAYVHKFNNVSEKRLWGFKQYQGYRIGVTDRINGVYPVQSVIFPVTPAINQTVEFIDGTINSSLVPTSVYFAHDLTSLPECQLNGSVLRDYTNSYYFMVPRKVAAPGDRLQNDCFIVKVERVGPGSFVIVSAETGHKIIRW